MKKLTMEQIQEIGLPKWPCMLVKGENITQEQAIEILFRTNSPYLSANDRQFTAFLARQFGQPFDPDDHSLYLSQENRERWGFIDLEYLSNDRINTAYVGGPKGWCNWNGTIFCNSFNIGKWPTINKVLGEWESIARAFPFLDLVCQLLDRESCEEGEPKALVQFNVKKGKVSVYIPKDNKPMMARADASYQIDSFMERINSESRLEHIGELAFIGFYKAFRQMRGF